MRVARNAEDRLLESSPVTLRLAVIMERRVLHNKWADHARGARALLPEAEDSPAAPAVFARSGATTH